MLIDELGFKCCTHEPCIYYKYKSKTLNPKNFDQDLNSKYSGQDLNPSEKSDINKIDGTLKLGIPKIDGTKNSNNLNQAVPEDDGKSDFIDILKTNTDNLTLIVWQVDDFLVANKDNAECKRIGRLIQERMTFPLNILGIVRKFNGVDVEQTQNYNHVHCKTYIERICKHHGWTNLPTRERFQHQCAPIANINKRSKPPRVPLLFQNRRNYNKGWDSITVKLLVNSSMRTPSVALISPSQSSPSANFRRILPKFIIKLLNTSSHT